MDSEGNFVITWKDGSFHEPGRDGSGFGVYAQRYNADGMPQGNEFQVNIYTKGIQRNPSVGVAEDGDFVIAWVDFSGQDGSGYGIYARRYTVLPVPEILLSGNGQEIIDGDASPASSDHTDFGDAIANSGTVTRTFTIANIGTAELTIGSVAINGSHISDFSVTHQPSSPVAPNDSATFQITFSPSATGTRTAEVSLGNNDADETPYNFAIQGHGVEAEAPEQAVYLPLIIK